MLLTLAAGRLGSLLPARGRPPDRGNTPSGIWPTRRSALRCWPGALRGGWIVIPFRGYHASITGPRQPPLDKPDHSMIVALYYLLPGL